MNAEGIVRSLASKIPSPGSAAESPWDIQVHNPRFFRASLARVARPRRVLHGGMVGLRGPRRVLPPALPGRRRGSDPGVALRLMVPGRAPAQPPVPAARIAGGRGALRPDRRRLPEHERQVDHAQLRLLEGRPRPRLGAGGQARPGLPQARPRARHARARYRLRLRGEALRFAAERYGVAVVGINVSAKQSQSRASSAGGLPVAIAAGTTARRTGPGEALRPHRLDRHVRARRLQELPRPTSRSRGAASPTAGCSCCTPSARTSRHAHTTRGSSKYIFPNGMLPSIAQIAGAIEGLFVMEDWHNFGADYELTLQAWRERSTAPGRVRRRERFRRMWRYLPVVVSRRLPGPPQAAVADRAVEGRPAAALRPGVLRRVRCRPRQSETDHSCFMCGSFRSGSAQGST